MGLSWLLSRSERHRRAGRANRRGRRSQQQPEREEMRPEQRWNVENEDRVTGPELPRHRRQVYADRTRRVDDEVGKADEIEPPDQGPEEETFAYSSGSNGTVWYHDLIRRRCWREGSSQGNGLEEAPLRGCEAVRG